MENTNNTGWDEIEDATIRPPPPKQNEADAAVAGDGVDLNDTPGNNERLEQPTESVTQHLYFSPAMYIGGV